MNSARSGEDRSAWMKPDIERILLKFEEAWTGSHHPNVEKFVEEHAGSLPVSDRQSLVEEIVRIDLEYHWRTAGLSCENQDLTDSGTAATVRNSTRGRVVEEYIRAFPELAGSLDLIVEEYRARRRWGDSPRHALYQQRFPDQFSRLEPLLRQVDDALGTDPQTKPVPDSAHETRQFAKTLDSTDSGQDRVYPGTIRAELEGTIREAPEQLPDRIGRYEVHSLLGEGSFGSVYLARDTQLDRLVAVKVLRSRFVRTEEDRNRFLQEARLAAKIRHRTLVRVYDVGIDDNACFLVMEYIDGRSLQEHMQEEGISHRRSAELVAELSEAVHEAHKVGLIHRDLKPANILIDESGDAHITDFGLAVHEDEQRCRAGEVAGTPMYMPPEQVRGETHRLDGRADIWSLGVVFYEMLTGRPPFTGEDVTEIFDEIQHREPKPPRQINDSIPLELEKACLNCLAKGVSQRYTTAKDLASDLRLALAGQAATPAESIRTTSPATENQPNSQAVALAKSSRTTATKSNLPKPTTQFVGRKRETDELLELLRASDTSIVTLIGPGGIGKSRLSTEVGQKLLDQLPGGCWWVELERLTGRSEIAHAVLQAMEVPVPGDQDALELAKTVLEYREPLLLILDNFEQAVDQAAATVGFWQSHVPHVRFLITSREPLGLTGERRYELDPLAAPRPGELADSAESCSRFDSVRLFTDRAREVNKSFQLNDSNSAAVAEICARLEGMPLAVELAASRVGVMKPAQLAKRLRQTFQILKSSGRDRSSRQQTLAGAIDWSYNLLADYERDAFLQASIFPGGFFLDAAEEVIDLSHFPAAPDVLDVVQSLRDKCLLRTYDADYELRFSMYESIRYFSEQKRLAELSEEAQNALAQRLGEYLLSYTSDWKGRVHSADALEALDRIGLEAPNLFAVYDRAIGVGMSETAASAILALSDLSTVRGITDEYMGRLENSAASSPAEFAPELQVALSQALRARGDWDRAVAAADAAVHQAERLTKSERVSQAVLQRGEMHRLRGEMDQADDCLRRSSELARKVGDRPILTTAIASQGFVAWQRGQVEIALNHYSEAADIARQINDDDTLAIISFRRGHVFARRGDHESALACFAEAERIARRLEDRHTTYQALSGRAMVLCERGNYESALQCYDEAEKITRQIGQRRGIAVIQGNRGLAMADLGRHEEALECYQTAERLNREIGTNSGIALNIGNRGAALAAMGQLDEALDCLDEAERLNRQIGNRMQIAFNLGDRGSVLQQMGRIEPARDALRECLDTLAQLGMHQSHEYFCFQTVLAVTEAEDGNEEEFAKLAQQARHLAEALELTDEHPRIGIRKALALLNGPETGE